MSENENQEAQAGEQLPLIPDEFKEEEDTREILIPLQPHEVLELVDRMATLNEELKGHKTDEENEKSRHKEEKEKIAGRISTTTESISKLIDQAGMRKRRSLEKTTKRINFTTKTVEWYFNGDVVDSRPMVPAEYQMKLLPDSPAADNVVSIADVGAAGVDPTSFEGQPAVGVDDEEVDPDGVDPANYEDFTDPDADGSDDHELGDNVVDDNVVDEEEEPANA